MYQRISTYAKPILLAILVYACLNVTIPRHADAAIIEKYLSVPAKKQEYSNWCWAASIQSVLAYYGQYPSQCRIVGWLYPGCPDWQAHINYVGQILRDYGHPNIYYARSMTFTEIKDAINRSHPSIARWAWTNGGGHMVTIYSYYQDTNTGVTKLAYINPSYGSAQVANYSHFKSNANWTWTHTSYEIQ